jgi:hypothetical protein
LEVLLPELLKLWWLEEKAPVVVDDNGREGEADRVRDRDSERDPDRDRERLRENVWSGRPRFRGEVARADLVGEEPDDA